MNKTFTDIIKLWPSRSVLANDLGVPMERVKKWAQRDSIPSEYWSSILIAADSRGIAISSSTLIHAASPTGQRATA